jgi:hypothetical protein
VLLAAIVRALVRGVRRGEGEARVAAAAAAGAVGAGILFMFVQSYAYSVGNVATLSFWLCAFVGAAVSGRSRVAAI